MRQRQPASRSLQARGLRRITLVVPESCADGLLQFARELLIGDLKQTWTIHEITGCPRGHPLVLSQAIQRKKRDVAQACS